MSIVTKQIASDVARQMTKNKAAEIKSLNVHLGEIVKKEYLKTIPKDILRIYKEYPGFFDNASEIQISGNGWNFEWVDIGESAVRKKQRTAITLDSKVSDVAKKVHNEVMEKKKQLSSLIVEIENTLYNLRTYGRVKEQFPEAFVFLPEKISTSLSINIESVRNKLK